MPRVTCHCGARYKVPESSVGKKSKCKHCGAVFTLTPDEEDVIAIAAEDPESVAGPGPAMERESFHIDRPPPAPAALSVAKRTYLSDVLWTFLFPSSPANLVAFAILCLCLGVMRPLASLNPFLGFFVRLLVVGWYCAFRFEVIRTAAAGEEHLPDVNVSQDMFSDMIVSFLHWIGTWALVFLPTVVYLFYSLSDGTTSGADVFDLLTGGVSGLLNAPAEMRVLFVLVVLGLCAWPIVVLCVAMGGFSTLARPDLIVLTVLKTLPAYAAMLLFMFVAVWLERTLSGLVGTGLASKAGGPGATVSQTVGSWILLHALVTCSGIYLDIVLMRLIGLHYHHFKKNFAWEWE